MLISREEITIVHTIKHWKTGEPFASSRKRQKYILECDNPKCKKRFNRSGRLHSRRKLKDGTPMTKHYCSKKCQHWGIMRGENKVCAKPGCKVKFYTYPSANNHYCSGACYQAASLLLGGTCKHSGCNEPVSKNNKNGYCRKHRGVADYKKHKAILYAELGNRCVNCGERDLLFLTIDHVNNDGGKYRKQSMAHYKIHRLLKHHRQNTGALQLLCMNCNHAKMRNGGELYTPKKWTRRSTKQNEVKHD